MLNKEKYYILNPAYFLRNDVHRAIIGSFDFPDIEDELYEKNAIHIIHPFTASMLSFFDGNKTLLQCIHLISEYFDISIDKTENIIDKYINNSEPLCIQYNNDYIILPINTIIEKANYKRREYYNANDFNIDGEVDLHSTRLYRPIKVIIEMNFSCYTDCKYCYADRRNPKANKALDPDQLVKLIYQCQEMNIPSLEINGGEILLHPQIDKILKVMSECGYWPFISTKIPLNEERLNLLQALGFKNIQISLDSIKEETLIKLLNVRHGYFERLSHTMELLDSMGFNWQVNTVITKENASITTELEPLINYLLKFKNLKSIKISPMGFPMYKGKDVFNTLKANLKEINDIERYIKEKQQIANSVSLIFAQPNCQVDYCSTNKLANFQSRAICTANQKGFVVLPNGEVTICEELYWNPHFIIGDISYQSIQEIWNSNKAINLFYLDQTKISNNSTCHKCAEFLQCRHYKGICWKMVIMAYGQEKWDYPDPSCPKSPQPNTVFYY